MTKPVVDPEEFAWQAFAKLHPHEAHEAWPDRFWNFFQEERPGVGRQEMEDLLKATDPPPKIGGAE